MTTGDQNGLDHAWRYFELHANQRMSVFNFFIVFSGFLFAGLAATIQGSLGLAVIGIPLGLLLALLAYVFWKLDQRASFMVKHAESALADLEAELPDEAQLFLKEPTAFSQAQQSRGLWTYGTSFRLIFLTMGLMGALGSGVSGVRYAGLIEPPTPKTEASQRPALPTPNKQDQISAPPPELNTTNRQ